MDYSIRTSNEVLSFDSILKQLSEEDIYSSYLGEPIKPDTKYRSIFRTSDSIPSLSFYESNGRILYKDFGMNDRAGNVFLFVQKMYGLRNAWEAVVQINHDFNLGLGNWSPIIPKRSILKSIVHTSKIEGNSKTLSFRPKLFIERDLYYWNKFNVSLKILQHFNVLVADIVYINHLPIWFYDIINPIYAYTFDTEKYKFYRPLAHKEGKFLSSRNIGNYYAGYKELPRNGNMLIITKAMKDVMTLYSLNISAIAPNGETYAFDPVLIKELKNRFQNIFIMLDNDYNKPIEQNTGINAMKNFVKSFENINPIIIPDQLQCTDIAEVMEKYGPQFTKNTLDYAKTNSINWR